MLAALGSRNPWCGRSPDARQRSSRRAPDMARDADKEIRTFDGTYPMTFHRDEAPPAGPCKTLSRPARSGLGLTERWTRPDTPQSQSKTVQCSPSQGHRFANAGRGGAGEEPEAGAFSFPEPTATKDRFPRPDASNFASGGRSGSSFFAVPEAGGRADGGPPTTRRFRLKTMGHKATLLSWEAPCGDPRKGRNLSGVWIAGLRVDRPRN